MQCCVRRKCPQCARCGAEVDVHKDKALLYFGIIVRFCNQHCVTQFLEEWRRET